MLHFKSLIVVAILALVLDGCASSPRFRPATQALLPTNRGVSQFFHDLSTKLRQHKYKIVNDDPTAGILLTAPRQFSFIDRGRQMVANQRVEIHQEGGAVKLRLSYKCNYSGDGHTFTPCLANDADAVKKIARVDKAFIGLLKPILRRPQTGHKTAQPAAKHNPWTSWGAAAQ